MLRFHLPLIEPDRQVSRIRLPIELRIRNHGGISEVAVEPGNLSRVNGPGYSPRKAVALSNGEDESPAKTAGQDAYRSLTFDLSRPTT